MAQFNPTLVTFSLLILLGLTCPTTGQKVDFTNFESPWDDLPRWSKDWSQYDWQTAFDRALQQRIYNFDRKLRDSSSPPSCASAWAKESAGAEMAAASAASTAGQPTVANQYVETGQKPGAEDNRQGPQAYQSGGTVFQHPILTQFNRLLTPSTWLPESAPSFPSQRSSAYYMVPNNQYQQYRSSSSGSSKHPVETLPDSIETPSAPKLASQNAFFSSGGAYRSAETPGANPQQSAEDINSIKTTNPQYYNYPSDYFRQQIQQALADGRQLVAGIPNIALNQQLFPGTADKLSAQASPVLSTTTFPVTTLSFDPEEMKRVYGPYYVPPVFSLVQKQPNSLDGAPVVRDVLQYLLNQYGGINGITNGHRTQRLLPDISTQHQKILHGFAPIQKLPRQSIPQLPSFTGDNQPLPPNVYSTQKWEPKTNLVVHDPVNLAEFEQSGMNQMSQMGQYAARSTPCSRQKRQMDNIWGYYPELTPGGARMSEPMPAFPGMKSAQSTPAMYGLEGSHMGRTAIPGLPGFEYPLRQSMGGFGQPMGGYGQPMDVLGQPAGGLGQAFGNPAYPDYYSNYQGRDAMSGLQQFLTGFAQFVPTIAGNGLPTLKK